MKKVIFFFAFLFCFTIVEDIICQQRIFSYEQDGANVTVVFSNTMGTVRFWSTDDPCTKPQEYVVSFHSRSNDEVLYVEAHTQRQGTASATSFIGLFTRDKAVIGYSDGYANTLTAVTPIKFPVMGVDPQYGYTVRLSSEWYEVYCPGEPVAYSGIVDDVRHNKEGGYYATDANGDILICISSKGVVNCLSYGGD